jgi:hypothetical protein
VGMNQTCCVIGPLWVLKWWINQYLF